MMGGHNDTGEYFNFNFGLPMRSPPSYLNFETPVSLVPSLSKDWLGVSLDLAQLPLTT